MDTNKMRDISREQFETRYPVPEGCCWNAEQGRYVLHHLKLCTLGRYERHVEHWVCWQASRESVVIPMPDMKSKRYWEQFEDGEGDSFIYGRYIGHVIAAIEAEGLRVAP